MIIEDFTKAINYYEELYICKNGNCDTAMKVTVVNKTKNIEWCRL